MRKLSGGRFNRSEISLREGDYGIGGGLGFRLLRYLEIEPDLVLGILIPSMKIIWKPIMEMRSREPEKVRVLPVKKDDTDYAGGHQGGPEAGI